MKRIQHNKPYSFEKTEKRGEIFSLFFSFKLPLLFDRCTAIAANGSGLAKLPNTKVKLKSKR